MALIHRLTSPNWFDAFQGHLATARPTKGEDSLLAEAVRLNTGEALLFAP